MAPNIVDQVFETIVKLENVKQSKTDFNVAYQQLTSIIKDEMDKNCLKFQLNLIAMERDLVTGLQSHGGVMSYHLNGTVIGMLNKPGRGVKLQLNKS
jgi:hypothetical protein